MRSRMQLRLLLACVFLLCLTTLPSANAQLPNLNTVTNTNTGGTDTKTATNTGKTTGTNTGTNTGTQTATKTDTAATTNTATSDFPSNVISTTATSAATNLGSAVGKLTGAPTLAGVGAPTLIVPYTASAPFMQKSHLPEGTVFIAVGAVLAFLGFCVIAWRALVAWSINRSVKRAALASIMASETKNPGGWASNPFKPAGGFYHQAPGGSTLDLPDHPASKQRGAAFRNPIPSNGSGLFFSPTASTTTATQSIPMTGLSNAGNRSSTFLPAGYYASPNSTIGGGASQTTIGGAPPQFASPTAMSGPGSPSQQPTTRRLSSQRPASMANLGVPPTSRDVKRPNSTVHLHPQASSSSLMVGTGHNQDDLPGSRAPSAYLEDLFEGHHGNPGVPQPEQRYR